ncbi:MAG: LysM peptidoglycan-binding domain-containing protein [Chloroflexi bacterium]|nr:LysM peptidoglycan-binding domain-containing protein [Chloroflexota bacterium]
MNRPCLILVRVVVLVTIAAGMSSACFERPLAPIGAESLATPSSTSTWPATRVPTSTRTPTFTATATQLPETTYVVQAGDTLSDIAKRFGTSVDALAAANDIANVSLIYVGQKLLLLPPSPATATAWWQAMATATQVAQATADASRFAVPTSEPASVAPAAAQPPTAAQPPLAIWEDLLQILLQGQAVWRQLHCSVEDLSQTARMRMLGVWTLECVGAWPIAENGACGRFDASLTVQANWLGSRPLA